ncbi:MAG TPA: N-acetylmuramoyl-L-alanine amidase [Candidatus Krumholzibacteria bacterium]|nr:N-acetylmuramoyl-L-alanine amidase [Candidatus Krumholzibacteria bacterium]
MTARPAHPGAVLVLLLAAVAAWPVAAQEAGPVDPLFGYAVDAAAPAVDLTVSFEATGETRAVSGRRLLTDVDVVYLPSATAASLLNAGRYWQGSLRRLELKASGRVFVLTADSRLVAGPDGETLLPVPVLDLQGDLWLPVTVLTEIVGPSTGERIAWDQALRRLRIGAPSHTVTALRAEVLGRTTAVHVACRDALAYRTTSPAQGVIELKIYGGSVDTGAVGLARRRGLLLAARSRQQGDDAVITLQVDDLVGRFRTYTADGGRDIVLVLEEEQVEAMPAPVPRGQAQVNIDQGPVDATLEAPLRTVVIDAGHGGHDVGAVGPRGILEKDVNLGVARALKRWLERESDLDVVLTREGDDYVELADRAEIANTKHGDLFLSLHCNSWFNDGAHGLETYFLSPAQSDWAQSVEAAENAAGGAPGDVDFIVWELVQNRFISSSSRLAETIQGSVSVSLGLPDRGVRQAGFRVLVGAYMPAVLIELGFLSHTAEEQRLGDATYQQQLAAAIGEAILAYRNDPATGGAGAPADGATTGDGR